MSKVRNNDKVGNFNFIKKLRNCLGQQFISSSANHARELQQQYYVHQRASTDLYNELVDMSDDDFEKLATAKSSYKLTKEQEVKYKDVIRTINEVAENRKKLHD
jgi:hypothetical protein